MCSKRFELRVVMSVQVFAWIQYQDLVALMLVADLGDMSLNLRRREVLV